MIKMFINDEEVVSNKELAIKEEMLSTPSTILNNCYPKAWENIKDYVSKFYYPRDYSRCIIAKGFERGEDRWLTYNESGSNINFDTNISLPFKNITIDGKSTQATSTNPVSPSPDYPSEIECVKDTIQIKDVGKNLFDGIFELGIINGSTGQNIANNSYIRSKNYIPVEELTDYKFSSIDFTGSVNIYEYKADFSYNLTTNKQINLLNYFTTNKDTKYIRFRPASVTTNLDLKFQLEKGTQATEFEPYKENILNIDLQGNELCSLPNNVKDELVIENGRAKIIKRVGKVVLNGTENWGTIDNKNTGDTFYSATSVIDNLRKGTALNLYCDKFKNVSDLWDNNNVVGTQMFNLGSALRFRILKTELNEVTINGWKSWLSAHNTEVYYALATPIEIDLGEVTTLSTFEGVNNVSLDTNMQTNMSLTYLYKNYELIFCGIVKNSGNISLNPRYPHFCDLQILDFKNFLSESDMLDFVISNKTVVEAINMVIEAIKDYGFILGNVNIFGADDIIKAYSTQNKTAYDVFQYLADITGSRWYTRTIDEETVAIDFYDPTLMPSGMNIEYNVDWFEENQIVDLQFNYGSRDYRNKQVMMSNEVFGNINYNETLISNGYETSYLLLNNIGEIVSITINGEEKTFVTNELHDIGFEADFYYTPNKNQLESEDTYTIGTQIVVKYIPIIEGRQVVYNYDEIMRINNQTGRKGIIARYETRNDTTSSKELEKIGETYIKYKGTSEINLLLTSEKDLYNIGQIVYFDSPINELTQSYMVKTKEIKIIAVADFQKVLYDYELTSSFNSEKEINYFDNQRSKNKGNIEEGETITRNIDIENSTEILFNNLSISEVTPTGDNILDCILGSPFID